MIRNSEFGDPVHSKTAWELRLTSGMCNFGLKSGVEQRENSESDQSWLLRTQSASEEVSRALQAEGVALWREGGNCKRVTQVDPAWWS